MKRMKKLFLIIVALSMIGCFTFTAYANGDISDPNGSIIGVSSRGLRRDYPENSLEGIIAAGKTGIDFILTDVSASADGTLILFADETTERMLDCETKNISELTFEELQNYGLKEYSGGAGAKVTDIKIPSLDSALDAARKNKFKLLLNVSTKLMPAVCAKVAEKSMTDSVALLVNEKISDIKAAAEKCEKMPPIIGVKRGNVIFAVLSYINGANDNGFSGVQLKTTNRYGINFNQTVLKRFRGTMRAVAEPADSKLCGAREDSEKWWDDLISRGYSVIITDEAELFTDYVKRNGEARERLNGLYKRYTEEWQLPDFASQLFNDYKKAYTDAKTEAERILADASVSLREINDCAASLQKAVDEINLNYGALENGTAGLTVSPVRIGLCVGAAAAVIAVQIFFFKKRKKG